MFDPNFISSLLACLLLLSGATIIITGLVTIRWRAVTPSVNDTLVTHGIYTHIRHPLYSGMFLELAGLSLWVPTVSVTIACLLGMVWVIIQARLEEMDLLERLPAYKDYMQQVPRFVPKLRQR
jgi:protein-S-isoprenylcysteine O-methyltransferase Ste14